jgi:hypothetical protein
MPSPVTRCAVRRRTVPGAPCGDYSIFAQYWQSWVMLDGVGPGSDQSPDRPGSRPDGCGTYHCPRGRRIGKRNGLFHRPSLPTLSPTLRYRPGAPPARCAAAAARRRWGLRAECGCWTAGAQGGRIVRGPWPLASPGSSSAERTGFGARLDTLVLEGIGKIVQPGKAGQRELEVAMPS